MYVGIIERDSGKVEDRNRYKHKSAVSIFCGNGRLFFNGKGYDFTNKVERGSIIAVMLDFEEGSVAFEVNGILVGRHFQSRLMHNEYVFHVILHLYHDKVSIINPEPP